MFVCVCVHEIPFHGASVHFLFVVEQAVGGAGDRDGGVQTKRFSCGQNQLTLQLQFVILQQRLRTLNTTPVGGDNSERSQSIDKTRFCTRTIKTRQHH